MTPLSMFRILCLYYTFKDILHGNPFPIFVGNDPGIGDTHFPEVFLEGISFPVITEPSKRNLLGSILIRFSTEILCIIKILGKILVSLAS